jgi:hypothetical protein
MGKLNTKQQRVKAGRIQWHRKPQTQVVQNKKAEQRRTQCRHKGSRDGADFVRAYKSLLVFNFSITVHKAKSRRSASLSQQLRTDATLHGDRGIRAICRIQSRRYREALR